MGIGQLSKKKANRVIGIDASTKSIAFAIFENKKPVRCGEVMLKGANLFERLLDAKHKTKALVDAGVLTGDYVAIESAWTGNNPRTGLELAYIYGAIIGELMELNPEVHKIAPISWQTGIGNPNLKVAEKDAIKKANPGKKAWWYQAEGRKMRKDRTMTIARKYFKIPSESDNVSDAVGLALHVSETLTR